KQGNNQSKQENVEKPMVYKPVFSFPCLENKIYPVIQVKDACFSYNDFHIFNQLNFSVGNNTRAAIVGKNGSGKTTLMKLLQGKLIPNKGEIVINPKLSFG